MPPTRHALQQSHQNDNLPGTNTRFRLFVALLLATIALFLVLPVLWPYDDESQSVLARVAEEPSPSSTPTIQECLENVAWPDQFEVPFVATFQKGTRYGPWSGNLLQYQYRDAKGELTANFRSYFPRCTNLPFVPLSFFGKPCEYYFVRDPSQNNQWQAYVYSLPLKKYFRLASNLGPMVPDFVARYQALRPAGCSNVPLSSVPLPVGNPREGTPVEWFLTSGTAKSAPSPASSEGYYAAIAKPISSGSPDNKLYKPPYAFTGEPPGAGILLGHERSVYGELVYEWRKFAIKSSFPKGTFTPPRRYTEIPGWPMPMPSPSPGAPQHSNCVVCHMSDPHANQTFYMERRRAIGAGIIDKKKKG
jgi:hypothetical protein